MTTTAQRTADLGPSITTGGSRKIGAKDKLPFRIDGVTYHLIRPKSAVLAEAGSLLDPTRPWTDAENGRVLLQFTARILAYVEDTPRTKEGDLTGQALLEARLNDPMDDLDLEALVPLFTDVMQGWFPNRPTGSPRASSAPRRASRSGGSRASSR